VDGQSATKIYDKIKYMKSRVQWNIVMKHKDFVESFRMVQRVTHKSTDKFQMLIFQIEK